VTNVVLTDDKGYEVLVNLDGVMCATVEQGPDPAHFVLTLADGHGLTVRETPSEILALEREALGVVPFETVVDAVLDAEQE
jgi:hypothetical protein